MIRITQHAIAVGAMLLMLAPTSSCAQRTQDSSIARMLRDALQPDSGQQIAVKVATSAVFPHATFYIGRRTPPFGRGLEDSRPRSAAVLVATDTSVLVARFSDLPPAWKILTDTGYPDSAEAVRRVLELLRLTGVLDTSQVLMSQRSARRKIANLERPEAIDSVRPPSAVRTADGTTVRIYADQPNGLLRHDFAISHSGVLTVTSVRLSDYKLRM